MKTIYKTLSLLVIFSFFSCKDKAADATVLVPKSSFDSPFPKRNKCLSNILGEELSLKSGMDTLQYKIISTKNDNLIINKATGDTVFFGKVCKYRGLYYFNEKINDSSYNIFSVKISGNLIYGLTSTYYEQLFDIDNKIEKGLHKKLVKHINRDTTVIRLHPDKKEMKYLYSSLASTYTPDTIINYGKRKTELVDKTNSVTAFESDEYDNLLKVYPNPAKDFINVSLQRKNKSSYQLADINGKTILQGYLHETENKIDLNNQQTGMYLLTVTNLKNQERETVKIIVN